MRIAVRPFVLTLLAMATLGLGLLVSPADERAAADTATDPRPGVHGLTTQLLQGANGVDVVISWAPPTAEQASGLTWTSVYFGANPQPILVFPPETNATVPGVTPGRYPVGVELDYGPRSSYTHAARVRTSVTVPRHLVASPSASPSPTTAVQRTGGSRDDGATSPRTRHRTLYAVPLGTLLLGALALAVRRRRARR